eukprot:1600161-Prymnesium_polylepis.1
MDAQPRRCSPSRRCVPTDSNAAAAPKVGDRGQQRLHSHCCSPRAAMSTAARRSCEMMNNQSPAFCDIYPRTLVY